MELALGLRQGTARVLSSPALRARSAPLRTAAIFSLIVIVGIGIPLAIRLHLGIVPVNDEWSYAKAALGMHVHHGVALQGFNQMFLVGQLVAAQPFVAVFGGRVASLAVFGAATAVLWLCTVFGLGRSMIGTSRALVLVGVVAVSPGFGLLSVSFMTDVPSTAAAWIALYMGIRAFEAQSVWRLLVAFLLGIVAFTFREQAVVVFLAFLAGAWLYRSIRQTFRAVAVAGTIVCAIACFVLEQLRHGVPHGDNPPFGFGSINVPAVVDYTARGAFTVALALSPLIVARLIRNGWRPPTRATVLAWIGAAIAAGALLAVQPHSVLMGNYLERAGAYPTAMVGHPAPAFGLTAWLLVQSLAIFAAVVMCGEVAAWARQWRRRVVRTDLPDVRRFMVYSYGLLLSAVYVVLAFLGQRQYDRYLLPLLPVVGVLLLSRGSKSAPSSRVPRRRRIMPVRTLCFAFVLATSLSLALTTYVRDTAVWRAAVRLTTQGVTPTAINAGSDWNGMHAGTALVRSGVKDSNIQYVGDMWAQSFPDSGDCYAVTLSPMPRTAWRLVRVTWARPYGTSFGAAPVYTYRRTDGHPFGHVVC